MVSCGLIFKHARGMEFRRDHMLPATSTSLLAGLREPRNDRVWSEFCGRYRPVLERFARRLGLRTHDAQDVAQETLVAFVVAYRQGKYHPDRGRLRSWLLGIAKNKVRDLQRRGGRELAIGGGQDTTSRISQLPDDRTLSHVWEEEWQRAVVGEVLKRVRREVEPTTMQAFELFALQGWPAAKVASHLGMTRNAVFLAKSHILPTSR